MTRPVQRPDLDQLARTILAAQRAGLAIPCQQLDQAHLWLSEDRSDRETAAQACQPCPARQPCDVAGRNESGGVWAGQDRTRT